ncbi:MAG: NUDIX hydrolase [Oscillospiraceae bacterium]|nr:NUDIX hydrolase [Oscillospiraceae bacterium]
MYIEKKISGEIVYQGKIVNVRVDTAEVHGGRHALREVVEHPGGVCVVPLEADGSFWCVRQFRYPFMEELIEFPAGKLERGEDPLACAVRELKEETGLTAGRMDYLGTMYPSPGYLDERIYLYLATELTQGEATPDEGEFLTAERISGERLLAMVMQNEVPDAKTVVGLFRARAHLEA